MWRVPAYSVDDIRRLAIDPQARRLTKSAIDGCLGLGLTVDHIWETLASAGERDCCFIKTVDSDKRPGEKLDVYDALVDGKRVYVKIKVEARALPPRLLVVLSYKQNEYYERTVR